MPLYTVLTGTVAKSLGFSNAMPTQSGTNPSGSQPGGNTCIWANTPSVHDPVVTGLSATTADDALLVSTLADKWAENDFTAASAAPPPASTCLATIPANAAAGSSWANGQYISASLTNAGASPAQLAALSAMLGQTIAAVFFVVTLNTVWWDYVDNTGHQSGSFFNRPSGLLYGTNAGSSCTDGVTGINYNEAEVDSISGGSSTDPLIYLAFANTPPAPPHISVPPLPIAIGGGGWGKGVLASYPAGGPPGAFMPAPAIEPIPPGPPVVALLCIPCCQLVFGYAI